MYRVAVILNESELLRSGYANIIPRLQSIPRLREYTFEAFTVVSLAGLFGSGTNGLQSFDALLVTTNATSDRAVLEALRSHRKLLADFLGAGKGIFISSQKKLSADMDALAKGEGATGFLPDHYEFKTVERPKAERDSGQGRVNVQPDGAGHLILTHPATVSAEMVNERCCANEFRRHFYRSHLVPVAGGTYLTLLADTSHQDPDSRALLMVGRTPTNQERVVISSIALDWEFHQELLANIVVYVAEGAPRVAFIRKAGSQDHDYDFLLTSARLSKIPHMVYGEPAAIPSRLLEVHDTYIYSPEWTVDEVMALRRNLAATAPNSPYRHSTYRRIYFFQRQGGDLTLTEHSTFSTVDLIIDRSAFWLKAQFKDGMWGGSFWITHDVLGMLLGNRIDCSSFIGPVCRDIRRHLLDGSYDGVMGATCGLLELTVQLNATYPQLAKANGLGPDIILRLCGWIHDNYQSQSAGDRLTACLVIHKLVEEFASSLAVDLFSLTFRQEISMDALRLLDQVAYDSTNSTEIDVCRWLHTCLLCEPHNLARIQQLVDCLKARQLPSGQWTNNGRTAHVLVFLLEHWDNFKRLGTTGVIAAQIRDIVYQGILSLRGRYHAAAANWDGDMQATANAVRAIGLYNSHYQYSTQDFLKIIEGTSDKMQSAALVSELSGRIDSLRGEAALSVKAALELQKAKQQIAVSQKWEERWRVTAIATMVTTVAIVTFLATKNPQVLKDAWTEANFISLLIGALVSLVVTWLFDKYARRRLKEFAEAK